MKATTAKEIHDEFYSVSSLEKELQLSDPRTPEQIRRHFESKRDLYRASQKKQKNPRQPKK